MEKIIINFMPERLKNGGIESFFANASCSIRLEDYEYIILSTIPTKTVYDAEFKRNGVRLEYLSKNKLSRIKKRFRFFVFCWKNKDIPIIVHWGDYRIFQYTLIARLAGCKKIGAHIHGVRTKENALNGFKKLEEIFWIYLFGWTPSIRLSCGKEAGKQVFKKRTYQIVHNGINLQKFRFNEKDRIELRNKFDLDNKFVICQIGRLSLQKNQIFSLRIVKQLSRINKSFSFLMFGDGENKKQIERYIIDNSLHDIVKLCNPVSDIEKIYSMSDLMLMPSLYEALGIVLIEAQSNGLPIICSQYIDESILVTTSTEQIELNKEKAWISAIKKFISEKRNRDEDSESGIKCLSENGFGFETMGSEIISAINTYEED